jgi:hypothetical protein
LWPPGSGIDMPSHPIVLPPGTEKPPPGVWGDIILPTHPMAPGGRPAHPIELPPLQIWGDPILPPDPERQKIIEWYAGWTLRTGWVVVGIPNVPAPTPSTAS